jgi:hypothetical protein
LIVNGRAFMKFIRFAIIAASIVCVPGCRRDTTPEKGLATPSISLSQDRVSLGSPIDITYKFVVAPDAPAFTETYRVFVGIVDADEQLMWTEDHNPPTPTTEWKPGQTITYTRTVFIPVYPYVGDAAIHMGLYSTTNQKRLPLNGPHVGQHAYDVARLHLLPQSENVFTIYKDGWHPAEVQDQNALVEWRWTKKTATLAFRNPKGDAVFYLELDNPVVAFNDTQEVTIELGGQTVDQFTLVPKQTVLKKIPLKAGQFGEGDLSELRIDVSKTFIPSLALASNHDPRELGVRVFHAFIQPVR